MLHSPFISFVRVSLPPFFSLALLPYLPITVYMSIFMSISFSHLICFSAISSRDITFYELQVYPRQLFNTFFHLFTSPACKFICFICFTLKLNSTGAHFVALYYSGVTYVQFTWPSLSLSLIPSHVQMKGPIQCTRNSASLDVQYSSLDSIESERENSATVK